MVVTRDIYWRDEVEVEVDRRPHQRTSLVRWFGRWLSRAAQRTHEYPFPVFEAGVTDPQPGHLFSPLAPRRPMVLEDEEYEGGDPRTRPRGQRS